MTPNQGLGPSNDPIQGPKQALFWAPFLEVLKYQAVVGGGKQQKPLKRAQIRAPKMDPICGSQPPNGPQNRPKIGPKYGHYWPILPHLDPKIGPKMTPNQGLGPSNDPIQGPKQALFWAPFLEALKYQAVVGGGKQQKPLKRAQIRAPKIDPICGSQPPN